MELFDTDEVKVFLGLLVVFPDGSRSARLFACKDVAVVFEDKINEGTLADARGAHEDERLVLEGRGVEGVEVLFAKHKDVVLLTRQKVLDKYGDLLVC